MPSKRWNYLSLNDVLQLHQLSLERFGGLAGLLNEGGLESCVEQPKTFVFGVERFPTAAEKAAAYCFFLVCKHPFIDGNKRVGFLAAKLFLEQNGYAPVFDNDEMFEAIDSVAAGRSGRDRLVEVFSRAIDQG